MFEFKLQVIRVFSATLPWSVASSVAGLLSGAAVDRKGPFAGVAAVCLSHTFFVQKAHLLCKTFKKQPVTILIESKWSETRKLFNMAPARLSRLYPPLLASSQRGRFVAQ